VELDPSNGGTTSTGSSVGTGVAVEGSTTAGASVVTTSSVGCDTSGVVSGGGVVSSASTPVGKTRDKINVNKMTMENFDTLLLLFILKSPFWGKMTERGR
jgi:hypothetical protein